jgi:hypothetical protein
MSKFSRKDIKDFIQNFQEASWSDEKSGVQLLSECGCEDSAHSLEDDLAYDHSSFDLAGHFAPIQMAMASEAPCPDSYNKTADAIISIPHEVVEMLMPAMQQLGIGCPASFAKAIADVLTVSQENGATPVFSVE